jgi:hypothetical protein
MKKLFLMFLMFGAAVSAMAAYQYNVKGNQGWLSFDGETTVAFDLTLESRKDKDNGQDNYIDRGNNYADFGWYDLDDTEKRGSFNNGASATFNKGDRIGFWVKDNAGNVYTSTKPDKNAPDNVIWGKSREINGGYSVAGGNFGSNGTQEYYTFKINTSNSGNAPAPSGQPLPGIIATLLVGGGALVYLKKRKSLYGKKVSEKNN